MGMILAISDVILISAVKMLINAFGISEYKDKKHIALSIAVSAVLSAALSFFYAKNLDIAALILYPLMFILSFKTAFGKIGAAQIYVAAVAELITILLSSCLTLLIFDITSFTYSNSDMISLLAVRSVLLILAGAANFKHRFKNLYLASKTIPMHIFVLILFVFICITVILSCNNLPIENKLKTGIIIVLLALLTGSLTVIVFSLLINVASKNYYTALSALLEKQVAAQIDHYEKLEKLNSDMRTFRHDYINHLNSINALIGEGCCSDAQDYIAKLTESTHRNEAVFLTGNRLADAILTDKSDSCKEHADIVFDGCITDKIDNSDICIILANALDNAAEACQKCAERSRITIASQIRQGYWAMTMKNPTVSADSEGLMKTSKKDERNHGFGLISIEQTVKKYDGTMAVSIKDGVFELSVVLKIPDNK